MPLALVICENIGCSAMSLKASHRAPPRIRSAHAGDSGRLDPASSRDRGSKGPVVVQAGQGANTVLQSLSRPVAQSRNRRRPDAITGRPISATPKAATAAPAMMTAAAMSACRSVFQATPLPIL